MISQQTTACRFELQIVVINDSTQSAIGYQWLEDSLKVGEKVPEDSYILKLDSEKDIAPQKSFDQKHKIADAATDDEQSNRKKIKSSIEDLENFKAESKKDTESNDTHEAPHTPSSSDSLAQDPSRTPSSPDAAGAHDKDVWFNR